MADIRIVLVSRGKPRFMLVSDLDHTMVQNEDLTHERLQMFNRLWNISLASDSLLVFSTGRSPALFSALWETTPLLTPHVLICSVGTEIFYVCPDGRLAPDLTWQQRLDAGWDRAAVAELVAKVPALKPQVTTEQRRHKLSYHLTRADTPAEDEAVIEGLRQQLAAAGLAAKVVYSGGVDVDVLALGAGKGQGLAFLLEQLKELGAYPQEGVQVNGDSGNDIELFQVPGVRGCIVSNAHPELLRYHRDALAADPTTPQRLLLATEPCAGGIIQALTAFGPAPAPGGPAAAAGALRSMVVQLALLQSNAQAGNLSLLADPGATWVTPGGRLLEVDGCTREPADAAAAGLTWVDDIRVRPLVRPAAAAGDGHQEGGADGTGGAGPAWVEGSEVAGQLLLVTYLLWGFRGNARDDGGVRVCSGVVRVAAPGEVGGYKLLHLHESLVGPGGPGISQGLAALVKSTTT